MEENADETVVESVARAMFEDFAAGWAAELSRDRYFAEEFSKGRDWRRYARAAIKAMREPTDAMLERCAVLSGKDRPIEKGLMRKWHIAMIDAALAETAAPVAGKARGQTEPVPSSSVSPVGEEGGAR